jgi:hypothetical protein
MAVAIGLVLVLRAMTPAAWILGAVPAVAGQVLVVYLGVCGLIVLGVLAAVFLYAAARSELMDR